MDAAKATMNTAKDTMDDAKEAITAALNSAGYAVAKKFEDVVAPRFTWASEYQLDDSDTYVYPKMTEGSSATGLGTYIAQLGNTMQNIMYYQEWVKTHAVGLNQLGSDGKDMGGVYDLLKDKLNIAKLTFISGDNSAVQEYNPTGTQQRCPCCGILMVDGVCPKCGCTVTAAHN
jgi:hypothetical protein